MAKKKTAASKGSKTSKNGAKALAKSTPTKLGDAGHNAKRKHVAEQRERESMSRSTHTSPLHGKSRFLRGDRIEPRSIDGKESAADLIDNAFLAYNAARLREACGLFTKKMLEAEA